MNQIDRENQFEPIEPGPEESGVLINGFEVEDAIVDADHKAAEELAKANWKKE